MHERTKTRRSWKLVVENVAHARARTPWRTYNLGWVCATGPREVKALAKLKSPLRSKLFFFENSYRFWFGSLLCRAWRPATRSRRDAPLNHNKNEAVWGCTSISFTFSSNTQSNYIFIETTFGCLRNGCITPVSSSSRHLGQPCQAMAYPCMQMSSLVLLLIRFPLKFYANHAYRTRWGAGTTALQSVICLWDVMVQGFSSSFFLFEILYNICFKG